MAEVAQSRRKPLNWLERLPSDQRAELEQIKRAWVAGEIVASGLSLSQAIVQACRARGIRTCGPDGVRAWLAEG